MSWTISIDRVTLPEALLPLTRQHCRILFNDDDALLASYLGMSITYLEHIFGWQIFGGEVTWLPQPAGVARYQCPVQPVNDFEVSSGGVDVSDDYRLESRTPVEPVWLVKIDGTAFPADAEVTLDAGFVGMEDLPPNVTAGILRITAKLYEYRETISELNLDNVPGWLEQELLTGTWIPRA